MKNKIGWCNATWNPVWGCFNNCKYCYARGIAKRFAIPMSKREVAFTGRIVFRGTEDISLEKIRKFEPFFLESQFNKKLPKKPQRIFVGSMSEIAHWERRWMEKVLDKIKLYPQHVFQFLTRHPEVYLNYSFPRNCWLGMTITKEQDINKNWISLYKATYAFKSNKFLDKNTKLFYSIEPILNEINPESLQGMAWVIIGAETGNRKGKIIPEKEWIEDIVDYCRWNSIPVYLKDSLKNIYPKRIKMFPENGTINKL